MVKVSDSYRVHVENIISNIPGEDFEIDKVIASDFSNGVVVVRNNKLAGRKENIKFLESVEPHLRQEFLNEGRVLSAMRHKNITEVYDIIEHDDVLLFRTEAIDGFSLKEVLDLFRSRGEPFPRLAATSIILKLMQALYYAHHEVYYKGKKTSIIHCDIKPSNIILSARSIHREEGDIDGFLRLVMADEVEPTLIDFGISRLKGANPDESGTLQYMSPAQAGYASGSGGLDWRTDVYQLLLVYHELLTGITPYFGLAKSEVISLKLRYDFSADKASRIPGDVRALIEHGTKRELSHSFRTEQDCIRQLSLIGARQGRGERIRRYRRPVLASIMVLLLIWISIAAFQYWDYDSHSIDSMVRAINSVENTSPAQLQEALERIQDRAFVKKYYEPLKQGKFRDSDTGLPRYPDYLDSSGGWHLSDAGSDSAGAFVGLLFRYSRQNGNLLDYAKEYAQGILDSESDGSSPKRYMYALIPAYEITHDKKYLDKLINVTDTLMDQLSMQPGVTQCDDMYDGRLFLFAYRYTNDTKYLEFFQKYAEEFIINNIDDDGYIYEFATVNASTPWGAIPDDKAGWQTVPTGTIAVGNYVPLSNEDELEFKETAGTFSRDYVEVIAELSLLYDITSIPIFRQSGDKAMEYYLSRTHDLDIDSLFISSKPAPDYLPRDTTASVVAISLYSSTNQTLYLDKVRKFLRSGAIRPESENGVISGAILLDGNTYTHSDKTKKNQSTAVTDMIFLTLGKK